MATKNITLKNGDTITINGLPVKFGFKTSMATGGPQAGFEIGTAYKFGGIQEVGKENEGPKELPAGWTDLTPGGQYFVYLDNYTPDPISFTLPEIPNNGKINAIHFRVGGNTYTAGDIVKIPFGSVPIVTYFTTPEQVSVTVEYEGTTTPDVQPVGG